MKAPLHTSVVIVGAGPAGLLLACELGVRGVPVLVVEEKPGIARHPKANTQSARTMEIYRKHGIAAKLRQLGLPPDRATDVAYFTHLFGRELFRVSLPSPRQAQAVGDKRWPTPESQYRITQMEVEPVLLERALSFPSVKIRFGWRAMELVQDDEEVRLTVESVEGHEREQVAADFAVGCDGGRSFLRKALGIRFIGESGLEMDFLGGHMLATYFRAPTLLQRFPHADTWMHWIMQPAGRAILVVIDVSENEFLVHFQLKPDQKPEQIDFAARLEAICGEAVPYQIISSAPWRAGIGLVAERYASGRCFLVGDAVHLFTPTGGFGLNTGIEDAFNLGWKLAAACQGNAGPQLLASYEIERLPIGKRNTHYALELARNNGLCPVSNALDQDGAAGDAARAATTAHLAKFARWEFDTPGVQLGARYDQSPIIFPDGRAAPPDSATEYVPSGVPGGRLPHAWLPDGRSLFDQLGPDFSLICLSGERSKERWRAAAVRAKLELAILDLSEERSLAAILDTEYVLVRPDQHIAWRGEGANADPDSILRGAVGGGTLSKATLAKVMI